MLFKTYLLVLCLKAIGIDCELFCDSPVIESAITIKDSTYLFRGQNYWIWNHISNYIEPTSNLISKTFTAIFQNDADGNMHTLTQIDAMFSSVMRPSIGQVDSERSLLYIFFQNEYYFLSAESCVSQGMCFPMLSSADSGSIPKNWSVYGGLLSNWFPKRMSASFQVGNYVILFHDEYARFVKLNPGSYEEWPPNNQKIDMNFQLIDDLFEMPSTQEVVMTSGLNYCRFNKTLLLNVNPVHSQPLNIPCDWKPNKILFLCEKPSTTIPTTLLSTDSNQSIGTQSQQIESEETESHASHGTQTTEESSKSTISTTGMDTISDDTDEQHSEDLQKKEKNLKIFVFVLIFSLIIIVITISIIGIACCVVASKRKTKYGRTQSFKMAQGSNKTLTTSSIATVKTIDSNTGEPHHSNS